MTDDEKDKYKVLAHEYNNSTLKKQQHFKKDYDVQKYSNDFWDTQKYLTKMFECISNNEGKNYCIKLRLSFIYFNYKISIFTKNTISRPYHFDSIFFFFLQGNLAINTQMVNTIKRNVFIFKFGMVLIQSILILIA